MSGACLPGSVVKPVVDFLVWTGLVRVRVGKVVWPVSVSPWAMWKVHLFNPGWLPGHCQALGGWFCLFRNLEGVIKWIPGRLLPRRWGFRIIGLEVGDRGG